MLLDPGDQATEAPAGGRLQRGLERRGERAGGIGDGEAAAGAAVVERDDAPEVTP
jgi:hypothetical protein